MAPPCPSAASYTGTTKLSVIRADIKKLTPTMVTKQDLQELSTTPQDAINMAVSMLRVEMTAQDAQIQVLETHSQASSAQLRATDLALARQ
ncbi:Hypothetical predicted protein [Pelobates cultripes]|uniref:Uncharacterized protein n=1 Tax=Pelobates cultripes TaxID=61616 RepID=A0AAD1T514_PELCU|nr:Hypothetical predicted protein [Pelobates cultripes]CAH2319368.1 Hypothetical predicted protein [Pelobates cultripes]